MTSRAAIALVLAIAACSSDGGDSITDRCVITSDVGSGGDPVSDAVAIGFGTGAEFRAIEPGASLELVMGNQGGWMVVPVVRLDGDQMAAGGACPVTLFEVSVGELERRQDQTAPFRLDDDGFWYSIEIGVFLSLDIDEVEGQEASIAVSIDDGDVSASVVVDRLLLLNER